MNPRATIALFFVTLAVVVGLVWLRGSVGTTRDAAEEGLYAVAFNSDDIRGIDITRGAEIVSLRRTNGTWWLVSPLADRADPEVVDRLLRAVRFLRVRDEQEDMESVGGETGLLSPRLRLDLRGPRAIRLDLGAKSALPGEIFARIGGDSSVLRVPDTIVDLAGAPTESFRDSRLTDLIAGDIEKFVVRRTDGSMTVRRERGSWIIEKPVAASADPRAVRDFLNALLGLSISGLAPVSAIPEISGLVRGQTATITMTPRGGGEALDLQIARDPDGENFTALFSPRGDAFRVGAAAAQLFQVSPEGLRDRSLGFVDIDTVDRIVLESDGRRRMLRRDGQAWRDNQDGEIFHPDQVDDLVSVFNATRVGSFGTAAGAQETGLQAPAQRVTFQAWLSENSAEEPAGGHPIAGAEFGLTDAQGNVYAREAGSTESVIVSPDLPDMVRQLVNLESSGGLPPR